jgi:ubiquinone/menaquinone biosynthesis C-methylase UbiE
MDEKGSHLEKIRAQFTRQADAYVRIRQNTDAAQLRALVVLSGARPEHCVLDVACGPGLLTLAFAEVAARVEGVDATGAFLARAREEAERRGLRNVVFRQGDAERLPFPEPSFDVVSCRAAFHHFPCPERVLAEMARVAQPGSRLLIADILGSEDPAKAEYHDRIERLCDPTHVRALPASAFDRLFRDAGLEVLLRPTTTLDWDVEEWMAHGGPDDDAAREIVALFEASLDVDRSGLRARREGGRLRFAHAAAVFVLAR